MNTLIKILIAMGSLLSMAQFTEEFKQSHQADMNKASAIYNSGSYSEVDGGVIIDEDANP